MHHPSATATALASTITQAAHRAQARHIVGTDAWHAAMADHDDDTLTVDAALDLATDEFDATPAAFADWLAKVTDVLPARAGYKPQNIRALSQRYDRGDDLQPWELAALFVAGPASQMLRARLDLLELYRQAHDADIKRRARELVEASGGLWDEGL